MGILDYFTPEARRGNRQALEGLLMQFIPPEMRPQLNLLAELNPVVSMERAGQDAQQLFAPDQTLMDRLAAGGRMASNMAGVVAPAMVAGRAGVPVANAVQDVLTGYSPMVQPFMADEFGGFRLYQGSPHNFAAERLVRMPDGSTQYVVGAPDRLPDVPTGAEVLQEFPLGRQRMDKIGTGEGAQAYGYGLYGAEAEGVARGYRDALTRSLIDGREPDLSNARDAASYAVRLAGDRARAEAQLIRAGNEEAARYLREGGDLGKIENSPGSMYELDINANPEDFLNWDVSFSEQSQSVRDALTANLPEYKVKNISGTPHAFTGDRMIELTDPNLTGRDAYILARMGQAGTTTSEQAAAASNALREAGIPGIRYLDSGSRGAGGTRNYVIFDENLINIVRKYGIAGAAAMLGMSQADVAQAMGQQPQGLLESGPQ